MKRLGLLIILSLSVRAFSQDLPHITTTEEQKLLPGYSEILKKNILPQSILVPPSSSVRTIGEWEELQGLLITWTSYPTMLREIVAAAKQECRVYIICSNAQTVISTLATYNIDTVNVTCIQAPFNSVWSRDYGPWSAYTNDVDTLITIDWIYNRPRPLDDVIPGVIATQLGTPLYQTTTSPWDLVNTGGNFMTDGLGTAFASNLILDDNSFSGGFGVNHTSAEIDTIMLHFMGINRYIKMTTLPYDAIHHIDMHMKLLDEETLLVGQYPPGTADGPQIEANLQYVLTNFNSVFGTPYKVVRIPMPADNNGQYPPNGEYYTYTNSSFINKTIIVPTYGINADTTALRIYREALPGYSVVGINSTASISALGALHCITKELGTADPLLISHQALPDTYDDVNPYTVNARIQHRSGINIATLYYRTDTLLPYSSSAMTYTGANNIWTGQIPAQTAGSKVYYYIEASSVSGKTQVRPLPAPAGYWHFNILQGTGVTESTGTIQLKAVFPNPSKGITCIPVYFSEQEQIKISLLDITGRVVTDIFEGKSKKGEQMFFTDTWNLSPGVYFISLFTKNGEWNEKLIVR